MEFKLLEDIADIREAFIKRFVMSWEEFQIKQKDWIAEMAKTDYPVTAELYERTYMWDRMDPDFPRVSMQEALEFLKEHSGSVLFMSEKGEGIYYQGKKTIAFIAEADAHILATRIEQEWYNPYNLAAQNTYDPNTFFPDDLYVFDLSMKWCIAFTHETTYEEEENRYCIICKI